MKAIEPSEIFVEQNKGTVNEDTVHVNPWLRFFARFFDYSLFFLALLMARRLLHGHLPLGRYEQLIPFEYFIWIPIEALFLSTWGTTPGKKFLRIKLRHGAKKKIDFLTALRRSFHVWFRGLGMGIPILNFLCPLVAYRRLKVYHKTSWDRDDHIKVTHAPMAKWRFFAAALVAIGGLLFYFHEKKEEIAQVRNLSFEFMSRADLQILARTFPLTAKRCSLGIGAFRYHTRSLSENLLRDLFASQPHNPETQVRNERTST